MGTPTLSFQLSIVQDVTTQPLPSKCWWLCNRRTALGTTAPDNAGISKHSLQLARHPTLGNHSGVDARHVMLACSTTRNSVSEVLGELCVCVYIQKLEAEHCCSCNNWQLQNIPTKTQQTWPTSSTSARLPMRSR